MPPPIPTATLAPSRSCAPDPRAVGTVVPDGAAQPHPDALAVVTLDRLVEARGAGPVERARLLQLVVVDHLALAETLARRYRFRGEDDDDLLQVARTGLVEACRRYDPELGPFLAFAVPTIRGVLKRHFRDHGWTVRPPRRTQELASAIWQEWPDLVQRLGVVPTERQIAEGLREPLDDVRRARHASQGYASSPLELALVHGDGPAGPGDETERCDTRVVLADAWAGLDEDERRLLRMRFWEQRSQSDIALALGTNQMQVSRLLTRLLSELRERIGAIDTEGPTERVA